MDLYWGSGGQLSGILPFAAPAHPYAMESNPQVFVKQKTVGFFSTNELLAISFNRSIMGCMVSLMSLGPIRYFIDITIINQ